MSVNRIRLIIIFSTFGAERRTAFYPEFYEHFSYFTQAAQIFPLQKRKDAMGTQPDARV
jgi:hypothetical protein